MLFKNVNDCFVFFAQNVKLVNEQTSSVTSIFAAFKPASVLKDTLAEAQRLVGLQSAVMRKICPAVASAPAWQKRVGPWSTYLLMEKSGQE